MLSTDHENTLMCLLLKKIKFSKFYHVSDQTRFLCVILRILTKSCVIWRFQNQKSIFGELPIGEYDVFAHFSSNNNTHAISIFIQNALTKEEEDELDHVPSSAADDIVASDK